MTPRWPAFLAAPVVLSVPAAHATVYLSVEQAQQALFPGGRFTPLALEYRESHGGQVRDAKWRAQFAGKSIADPLQLDRDIRNISGATLSCRHVTDGVKRVLAMYESHLKQR